MERESECELGLASRFEPYGLNRLWKLPRDVRGRRQGIRSRFEPYGLDRLWMDPVENADIGSGGPFLLWREQLAPLTGVGVLTSKREIHESV